MVVKRDGSRVPFDGGSLQRGLQAACGKRPIPQEAKDRLCQELEDELKAETATLEAAGDPATETFERLSVKPKRANVTVKLVALVYC